MGAPFTSGTGAHPLVVVGAPFTLGIGLNRGAPTYRALASARSPAPTTPGHPAGSLLLMIEILHYLREPQLWE